MLSLLCIVILIAGTAGDCVFRAHEANPAYYEEIIPGWTNYIPRPCPYGTVFNPFVCGDGDDAGPCDSQASIDAKTEAEAEEEDETDEAPTSSDGSVGCMYRAGSNSSTYEQYSHGWFEMPCPAGTFFNAAVCDDVDALNTTAVCSSGDSGVVAPTSESESPDCLFQAGSNSSVYSQYVASQGWIEMKCPPGTAYNRFVCDDEDAGPCDNVYNINKNEALDAIKGD